MGTLDDLEDELRRIDGRGYRAYRDIRGAWTDGAGFTLFVDHVQADPFASPSRVRIRLDAEEHGIPAELWDTDVRRTALCDFLLRRFARAAHRLGRSSGSGKSGRVQVDAGGAEVLARSGSGLAPEHLEVRFRVGLPARGRTVLGRAAAELLTRALPEASDALLFDDVDPDEARAFVDLVDDHRYLQESLRSRGLVAFVRDGSILPRASGVSSRPMQGAVPFRSPESLRVTLPTRHHGEVTGMGIPEGITLVTGGGFHGKTTLLEAVQNGVYPHVPGDGREWVVTREDAVKVRSEDGRAVAGVDLRPFIHDLPGEKDTRAFDTEDASGSTSLAATVLEALEVGSRLLLLDEDTCATNLLIRDARMQRLVDRETIVPLVDRAREMHDTLGVSMLLVLGGSGDYLDVADRVLLLEEYLPRDASGRAREIARERPTQRTIGGEARPLVPTPRCPLPGSFDPRRGGRDKVRSRGLRELSFGEETVDLSALEQLVDDSQARAVGVLMKQLGRAARPDRPLVRILRDVLEDASADGLYAMDPLPELAMPRLFELAGAVNRLRSLRVRQAEPG